MDEKQVQKVLKRLGGKHKYHLIYKGAIQIPDSGDNFCRDVLRLLAEKETALARKTALLKKHEWGGWLLGIDDPMSFDCLECGEHRADGHAPDCAIAAELSGLPNQEVARQTFRAKNPIRQKSHNGKCYPGCDCETPCKGGC